MVGKYVVDILTKQKSTLQPVAPVAQRYLVTL